MTTAEFIALATACVLAASRLLRASQPLWGRFPKVAVFLPPALVVATYLAEHLSGAATSLDIIELIVVAIALAAPGAKPAKLNYSAVPNSSSLLILLVFATALGGAPGCAALKPATRTVHDVAQVLCETFFAERQGISIEDAGRAFCSTEEQLRPFIDEALRARVRAGTRASAGAP